MEEENESKQPQPDWLTALLETEFYSYCETHGSKINFFCLDCKGLALCEACSRDETHSAHHILQVYKCSHQVSMKIDCLRKFMDVSHIQSYVNNEAKIVYIHHRSKKQQPNCPNNMLIRSDDDVVDAKNKRSDMECVNCGWQLLESTPWFCSIECKVKCGEDLCRKQPNKNKSEIEDSSEDNESKQPEPPSRYKSRRKQAEPKRAPFN